MSDTDSYKLFEATDMLCPVYVDHSGERGKCKGDKCMAWRWSQAEKTKAFSQRTVEIAKEKDLNIKNAFDWVWKEEGDKFKRTEGYCGLAGYPHNSVKP